MVNVQMKSIFSFDGDISDLVDDDFFIPIFLTQQNKPKSQLTTNFPIKK